ncbi:MAG: carboxymuconolactone decarboxylase family protein [Chloroflexi bacterium]|nr:carboxymuconolactone decarboxylase family protein [Chloroflexota bacterium]
MAESEAFRRGLEVRGQVSGDPSSDAVLSDPVMGKFRRATLETVWGVIWARPGLDMKTKTLITLVSDVATGRTSELPVHLRFALRAGWTQDELTDVFVHLLGYIGAPLTREAFIVAREVFAETPKAE